jgi:hypothetical protein
VKEEVLEALLILASGGGLAMALSRIERKIDKVESLLLRSLTEKRSRSTD